MFERMIHHDFYLQEYGLKVLSGPSVGDEGDGGPWVVQLDTFFSEQEAQHLIELGTQIGFERSTVLSNTSVSDDGSRNLVSDIRTSSTAWCDEDECMDDAVIESIFDRMEYLTQINMDNSEVLQFLEYNVGGFYKEHTDYIPDDYESYQGVRILTIFLYLNHDGLEGGGTNFPSLGVTVQPKVGRAVLWPSVLDENPHQVDERTIHEALPVTAGLKYGVNSWIHQRPIDC